MSSSISLVRDPFSFNIGVLASRIMAGIIGSTRMMAGIMAGKRENTFATIRLRAGKRENSFANHSAVFEVKSLRLCDQSHTLSVLSSLDLFRVV